MNRFLAIGMLGAVLICPAVLMAAPGPPGPNTQPALPADTRCSLSAGAPVIDYGSQSRGQLQTAGNSQTLTLGKRTLMLNIGCPYSLNMRLALRGAQAQNGDLLHGDRGAVKILVLDAQVDGQTVLLTRTTPDGLLQGGAETGLRLQPGDNFAATQNGHLVQGKSFTARIEIEPLLPESATRVSTRKTSESLLILELVK